MIQEQSALLWVLWTFLSKQDSTVLVTVSKCHLFKMAGASKQFLIGKRMLELVNWCCCSGKSMIDSLFPISNAIYYQDSCFLKRCLVLLLVLRHYHKELVKTNVSKQKIYFCVVVKKQDIVSFYVPHYEIPCSVLHKNIHYLIYVSKMFMPSFLKSLFRQLNESNINNFYNKRVSRKYFFLGGGGNSNCRRYISSWDCGVEEVKLTSSGTFFQSHMCAPPQPLL